VTEGSGGLRAHRGDSVRTPCPNHFFPSTAFSTLPSKRLPHRVLRARRRIFFLEGCIRQEGTEDRCTPAEVHWLGGMGWQSSSLNDLHLRVDVHDLASCQAEQARARIAILVGTCPHRLAGHLQVGSPTHHRFADCCALEHFAVCPSAFLVVALS
jgi:hypothetical protein